MNGNRSEILRLCRVLRLIAEAKQAASESEKGVPQKRRAEKKPRGKRIVKSHKIYMSSGGSAAEFTKAKLAADYALVERLDACFAEIEGQAYAVQAVKEYLFGINGRENARGVGGLMVFLGPPAVGKTMMGEKIAEALRRPFLRLDMSGFNDREVGLCDLFGINKSYKAAQEGELTSFAEQNPVSVIMLDEFEKAHANVHNRFLQIFDRGEVQDLFTERNVSFRDAIVIVTMNLGQQLYNRALMTYNLSDTPQKTIVHALKSEIDPRTNAPFLSDALVSRLASGRIILFNRLRPEILHRIVVNEIVRDKAYYAEKYGLRFEADESLLAKLIILGLGEGADVRAILKSTREFFERNLERTVKMNREEGGGAFTAIRCEADFSSATPEAQAIFRGKTRPRVLVCCKSAQKGIFQRYASEKLELIFAKRGTSPRSLADGDISLAILDASEETRLFSGKLFGELIERELIPVYVYDTKAASDVPLLYFLDHGATDVFRGKQKSLEAWIDEIFGGLELTGVVQTAFRAGKTVRFDTSYSFEEGGVTVRLSGIDFVIARESHDIDSFVSERQIPNVRFSEVYGAKDAKTEMMRMQEVMKNYKKYLRMGVRLPRGILLEGPPGTGKTMLAKALASEAGMPFIQRNASEFGQKYVGEGARLMRETFETARRYAPSIVFIDEVDTIAKHRERGAREWASDVLNALLSQMDGFSDYSATPVFVIAATNFSSKGDGSLLDPAFLRRFDRKIRIDLPDLETRKQYLSDQIARYTNDVSARTAENIAKRSIGWSFGELDTVLQNALREALCADMPLTDSLLNDAFERYADGETKERDEKRMKSAAIHEAGHAVVAAKLGMPPAYATVGARGGYAGYVYYGDETAVCLSREECLDRICVMLAGRTAETVFFGEAGITAGARSDLKAATETAKAMLCDYGMDDAFPIYLEPSERENAPWVTEKAIAILNGQSARARTLIEGARETVRAVADALLERIHLDETDLRKIIEGGSGR